MNKEIRLVFAAGTVLVWLVPQQMGAGGICTAARIRNWQDMGCSTLCLSAGGPPKSPCPTCDGMPRWWVSEPYIDLCLADTPLSYRLSSGKEMNFTFYYRQRTTVPDPDEITGWARGDVYPSATNTCGTNASWQNNWNMSIVLWDECWETNWGPPINYYIRPPPLGGFPVYSKGYQAYVCHPEGGISYFNVQQGAQNTTDPASQARLTGVQSGQNYPVVAEETANGMINAPVPDTNGIYWGDPGIGLELVYPDGSMDIFGLTGSGVDAAPLYYTFPTAGTSTARLLLTQRIDPQGRVTRLGYQFAQIAFSIYAYRLQYVVDSDGRTNTFHYGNGFQISEIDDPYGRKAMLNYYPSNAITCPTAGLLSNIVDAVGNASSFSYQSGPQIELTNSVTGKPFTPPRYTYLPSSGWLTNLSTPYGNTSFCHYELGQSDIPDGVQQRGIFVTEPEGARQLFCYIHNAGTNFPGTAAAPTVPGQSSFDDGSSGATGEQSLVHRNTFHWGRRQCSALSSSVQSALAVAMAAQTYSPAASQADFASALASLHAGDYATADMKHWLVSASDGQSITEGLSSERLPSFDAAGNSPGPRIWYNYGKLDAQGQPVGAEELGANPQITCIAQVLPDGTTQYQTYGYYPTSPLPGFPAGAGLVCSNTASYSKPDGTIGALTTWFNYAANSVDLINISNSAGQYVNAGYNGNHQVIAITNALGQVTTCTWDPYSFNLTGVHYPSGQNIALGYYMPTTLPSSTSSMLQWLTLQPVGRCVTNNNYSAGLPASVTDDRGLTVLNSWDGLNRLTATVFPDSTTESNVYSRLDLAATKDRLGNWAHYAYDGLQHLTNVVNANNAVTFYSYCGCGLLNSILDALGNYTYLNYDNQGNLTNVLFPDFSSLSWQYDLAGRVSQASDGAGRWLSVGYNNQSLPTSIASANGTLESVVYDALNRRAVVTDANGVTVTNTFDSLNFLVKRTWPDGVSEGYGYSAAGLIAYTNRDQMPTYYTRDGAGRLTAVTNANHEVTQFAYDSLNNVTNLLDGNTNQTRWQYNQYGWLTNKIDGLNRNAFRYAYNPNGWLTNRWTPEKGNTAYTYDGVGNLKSILYPQSSILYAYDALNRLTNMLDVLGNHTFGWTPDGQLASESDSWTTNSWSYLQGLRMAMTISQSGGNWNQTYGYDNGWRMTNTVSPAGAFGYHYQTSLLNLPSSISLPNGATIVNTYDSLARLTGTALNNYWGHTLDGYTYTPDALGLRANIVRNLGLTTSTVNVGFDKIGQLTSWSATEPGGTLRQNEQLAFGYDPAHSLHSRTNGGLSQTFATDAANELTGVARIGSFTLSGAMPAPATGVTVNGQAAQVYGDFTFARTNLTLTSGNNTFTIVATNVYGLATNSVLTLNLPQSVVLSYDNNGNLTNDGLKTFAYDSENQLTNVFVPGQWRSDFVYDGLNRRRIERDYAWNAGTWLMTNETRIICDGYLPIQERNSNTVLITYTRGLDFSGSLQGAGGIGGLLARSGASGSTFYHSDGNGNITALIDGSENIVARYFYGPYGKLIGEWGSMANVNEMQFSSMPRHSLAGLSLFAFRPYDPNLQRWLNQDPIGALGGINLYGFVLNNPLNRLDPFGLQAEENKVGQDGEINQEIMAGLRNRFTPNGKRLSDSEMNDLDNQIDRNTIDANNKFEPNLPYSGTDPIMRPLTPKGQQPELPLTSPRPGNKGPTSGILCDRKGNQFFLMSGQNGPAKNAPGGPGSGFDAYTRTHVEGHAAALMSQQGMNEATLYINNPPCFNCNRNLPSMLPPSSTLTIVLPDGTRVPYGTR